MLFSSTVFLFCFLPMVSFFYLCARPSIRQYVLAFASLFFYAWGEPDYVAVMLFVCLVSYLTALRIKHHNITHESVKNKAYLGMALCVDLGILFYFKYYNFFIENINNLTNNCIPVRNIVMPIGISFFIFQSLSYVIDVYRGEVSAQKSLIKVILYISFFPQLIAGPIVKYHDIQNDIEHNNSTLEDVVYGIKRFIIGLGKKVLIANQLGVIADQVFNNGFTGSDLSIAWLGAVSYSLQLFFDFSGYSDMAIGLGRMFGFHFLENFNYPYMSKSISEFWRRWHISLGAWFKEYVYIPLGGNKYGTCRTYMNLALVFLVTGVWHGANWTFIIWGIWHGLFIIVERVCGLEKRRGKASSVIRHIYTVLVFVIGWVMFRADTVSEGIGFIATMFGVYSPLSIPVSIGYYLNLKNVFIILIAVILSVPVGDVIKTSLLVPRDIKGQFVCNILYVGILIFSISALAASTYNPFIYFRF